MVNRSKLLLAALLSIGLPAATSFSSSTFSPNLCALNIRHAQATVVTSVRKDSISRSAFLGSSAALLLIQSSISNASADEGSDTIAPILTEPETATESSISNASTNEGSDTIAPIGTEPETATESSISNASTNEGSDTIAPIGTEPERVAESRTIEGCPKPTSGKPNNCVATANIKQLATYIPPWTFEVSPDVAFAKLKGLVRDEPSFTVAECDESSLYLKVNVKRNFSAEDVMEFLVKGDDKVVVLKSYEKDVGSISDFGANRKRMDDLLQKSSDVFRVMGGGLTADSYEGGAGGKRNGALGQLKAFYGLQSGQGFQEDLEE